MRARICLVLIAVAALSLLEPPSSLSALPPLPLPLDLESPLAGLLSFLGAIVKWFACRRGHQTDTELELGSQCSSPPRRRLDLPDKASPHERLAIFPLH